MDDLTGPDWLINRDESAKRDHSRPRIGDFKQVPISFCARYGMAHRPAPSPAKVGQMVEIVDVKKASRG